ncbi:MAG: hypothetical protein AAF975_08410, partial [Spirochaetota bacterium]
IRVQQDTQEQAQVQIQGNQALYGPNSYYHSRIGIGEILLFSWLFRPHAPYYSPFAWGYYPSYYGMGYSTVGMNQYRTRTTAAKNRSSSSGSAARYQKSSKPQFRPTTTSPKASRTAAPTSRTQTSNKRSSLSSPSRSQRSFSTIRRGSSRSGSSFGFGK